HINREVDMLANYQPYLRIRLLIASGVGFLIAIIATAWIFVPTLGLLSQFLQFPPLARAAIVARILSPVLSFFLVTAWVWVLLWIIEWISSRRRMNQNLAPSIAGSAQQQPSSYRLELIHSSH